MRSALQDLMKFGPPTQWSGAIASMITPERRSRMKFEWSRLSSEERRRIELKWKKTLRENLCLYIRSIIEDIERESKYENVDDIDEVSSVGAIVGVSAPGYVEPKGFSLRPSKKTKRKQ